MSFDGLTSCHVNMSRDWINSVNSLLPKNKIIVIVRVQPGVFRFFHQNKIPFKSPVPFSDRVNKLISEFIYICYMEMQMQLVYCNAILACQQARRLMQYSLTPSPWVVDTKLLLQLLQTSLDVVIFMYLHVFDHCSDSLNLNLLPYLSYHPLFKRRKIFPSYSAAGPNSLLLSFYPSI